MIGLFREKLQPYDGQVIKFRAVVERYGIRGIYKRKIKTGNKETVMLRNVKIIGKKVLIADHIWFDARMFKNKPNTGETITFESKVSPYVKRIGNDKFVDWKLETPRNVENASSLIP